jgi:hypothetical protein
MSTDNAQPAGSAMNSITTAIGTAGAAVRDGARSATARVQEVLPAAGQHISKFVYTSCYFMSYGVVFPTVFVANFVPGLGPIAAGVNDGASAARDYVHDLQSRAAARKQQRQESQAPAGSAAPSA